MELFYDLEIEKCIPDRKSVIDSRYRYCKGWTDFSGMGVSVIGFAIDNEPVSFEVRPFDSFNRLLAYNPVVIGFNSKNFDDKVLNAQGIKIRTHIDLLDDLRYSAFGSTDWRRTPRGHKYSLGEIAKANGMQKLEDGVNAPELWQDGLKQRVIDYCMSDVEIMRNIYLKFIEGVLINPNTNEFFSPPIPF
jgi:hypothetical protein